MREDLDKLMDFFDIDVLLHTGSGFISPTIYYLTGFLSPDEITYVKRKGSEPLVVAAFHTSERVKKQSFIKNVRDITDIYVKLIKEGVIISKNMDKLLKMWVPKEIPEGSKIGVPDDFPATRLLILQKMGYEIKAVPNLFDTLRETKSPDEVEKIRQAAKATMNTFERIIDIINNSEIRENNMLYYDGNKLTVGYIKKVIEHTLLDNDAENTEESIVVSGPLGYDFHYLGNPDDILKAKEPIIIDIFPRHKFNRYYADVTRTIIKGTPEKEVHKMYETVNNAIDASIDAIKAGASIGTFVDKACEIIENAGYQTVKNNPDAKEGFTHSLGHGIGLDIHEYPSLREYDRALPAYVTMAIEPGIYLKKYGGVRTEDDVFVDKNRVELITKKLSRDLIL